MKVIFIISFSPVYNYVKEEEIPRTALKCWTNQDGLYVAVWEKDWGAIIGDEILAINTGWTWEVWRPDYRADKVYTHVKHNGLIFRSFPSSFRKIRFGLKKREEEFSGQLEGAMAELCNKKERFIVILPISDNLMFRSIYKQFKQKIPFLNPHFSNNETLLCNTKYSLHPVKSIHRWFLNRNYSKLLKGIKDVTVPQQKYSEELKQKYGWNVSLFAAGFDPEELPYEFSKSEAREKLNINQEDFVLLCSSRIVPEKQIDKLLMVLSGLQEFQWKCYITGYGPDAYVKEIRKLQESLTLNDRVQFVGHVSSEKLKLFYQASDLFFMTSILEAGPGSANMAAWYGLPIISTKTGSVAELLEQENAGYLVDPKNYEEWKKALIYGFSGNKINLLDKDLLLRAKGRKSNMERMANTIKNVYNSFYMNKPN